MSNAPGLAPAVRIGDNGKAMKPSVETSNFRKHTVANPLQRMLIGKFHTTLTGMVRPVQPRTVLDAGCGEGFTLDVLDRAGIGKTYAGIDASADALALGRRMFPRFALTRGDVYHLDVPDAAYDLVVCSEVLEHLKRPGAALDELSRVTRGHLMLTVPWEPFFRLTNFMLGKYPRTWGNHPEHVNHWSRNSFTRFVASRGLTVVAVRVSFPWILVLARPA